MSDNKEIYIDRNAVAAIDAKIKETSTMTRGLMSSWSNPMAGVESGPQGKITPPKKELVQEKVALHQPPSKQDEKVLVTVPMQGMKALKALLPNWFEIEVRLTPEQARMYLEALQAMPTPKKMFDAKAIFSLMESLGGK